jgi:hypothetical protein
VLATLAAQAVAPGVSRKPRMLQCRLARVPDTNGTPTTVNLSGTTTLRLTMLPGSAEDLDYIAFRPKAVASNGSASFSAFTLSADRKSLTLTYTGTLQSAPVLQGPWADVPNAVSPYTATIATGNLFFRVH